MLSGSASRISSVVLWILQVGSDQTKTSEATLEASKANLHRSNLGCHHQEQVGRKHSIESS